VSTQFVVQMTRTKEVLKEGESQVERRLFLGHFGHVNGMTHLSQRDLSGAC
jgi:ABC-type antimicrobial peptide transport system ATPase subunit